MILEGLDEEEIVQTVFAKNLFQYPSQRMLKDRARVCLRRMKGIQGIPYLLEAVAQGAQLEARQAVLVAMMRDNGLVAEFMVQVIGRKYQQMDLSFTRKDINTFFMNLQQQNAAVAAWSQGTVERIKGVLVTCLKETEHIQDMKQGVLQPVLVSQSFTDALRSGGLSSFLPAFNVLI